MDWATVLVGRWRVANCSCAISDSLLAQERRHQQYQQQQQAAQQQVAQMALAYYSQQLLIANMYQQHQQQMAHNDTAAASSVDSDSGSDSDSDDDDDDDDDTAIPMEIYDADGDDEAAPALIRHNMMLRPLVPCKIQHGLTMNDDSLNICSICTEHFNLGPSAGSPTDRRPVLTPNCCGNTLCMQCAELHRTARVSELSGNKNKIPCPFCNAPFHSENAHFLVSKFAMSYLERKEVSSNDAPSASSSAAAAGSSDNTEAGIEGGDVRGEGEADVVSRSGKRKSRPGPGLVNGLPYRYTRLVPTHQSAGTYMYSYAHVPHTHPNNFHANGAHAGAFNRTSCYPTNYVHAPRWNQPQASRPIAAACSTKCSTRTSASTSVKKPRQESAEQREKRLEHMCEYNQRRRESGAAQKASAERTRRRRERAVRSELLKLQYSGNTEEAVQVMLEEIARRGDRAAENSGKRPEPIRSIVSDVLRT